MARYAVSHFVMYSFEACLWAYLTFVTILPCRAKTKHDDDDYKVANLVGGEEANYYMQAHSVRENIAQQASIMVNGLLKEYQVEQANTLQCSDYGSVSHDLIALS